MTIIPKTVEAAVDELVNLLSEEDRNIIKSREDFSYHFSAGMNIRNKWCLWEKDTPLKLDAINTYGIAHGDDISGLIFEWAFAKIRGIQFNPFDLCKSYHKHWEGYGMTSLEAGGYKHE